MDEHRLQLWASSLTVEYDSTEGNKFTIFWKFQPTDGIWCPISDEVDHG